MHLKERGKKKKRSDEGSEDFDDLDDEELEEEDIEEELFDEEDEDLEEEDIEEDEFDDEELDDDFEDDEEEDEEFEDEELEEEPEEENLPSMKEEKPSMLPIVVVIVLVLAGIAGGVLIYLSGDDGDDEQEDDGDQDDTGDIFDDIGNDQPSNNPLQAVISEIMPSGEWIEIYIRGESPGSAEGWTFTTFDENLTPLPTVTGLDTYDYILVYMGSGEDDTDASDGYATVYLGLSGDVLEDTGDEVALFDSDENIIDFAAWGPGNGDTPRESWTEEDYLPEPSAGKSISLQGEDTGVSSMWTEGPPSPNGNNILSVPLDEEWDAHIYNGRSEDITDEVENDNVTVAFINVNVSAVMEPGHPVNRSLLENVSEYIDFTYKLLKEMGFGDALASGTDSEGNPFVKVSVSGKGTYSGLCRGNGEMHVDIGSNKAASKQTVEHEMTHNFQFAKRADGSSHVGPLGTRFVEEGMAEYMGRYSAMKNYNLTWQEMEEELKEAGSLNIYVYNYSWENVFTDWYNATAGYNYTNGPGYYYGSAFLFVKFLSDKFGKDILSKIHNATSYNWAAGGAGAVVGIAAIEKATGMKFEDLLREFMLYKLENRYPQYKDDPNWKGFGISQDHTFNGSAHTESLGESEYGSILNRYNLNGSGCVLKFDPKDDDSRWQITIVMVKGDGGRDYRNDTLEKGDHGNYNIPSGYQTVYVIKTRLNGSIYRYEFFNMSIFPPPVITPSAPNNGAHIMWDPPYINYTVDENLLNASVRVQVDNTSTFSNPWYDDIMWDPDPDWSLPLELPNGTWWWRLRWETEDLEGPWSQAWNFTLWRRWNPPGIMWDPEPVRFVNDTGNRTIVIPGMNITFDEYVTPEGVDTGPGTGQVRFRGPDSTGPVVDVPFGDTILVDDYMDPGYDIVEWRVHFPGFGSGPWFRDDIMWDPAPPDVNFTFPEGPIRINENITAEAEVRDDPDPMWADSFFDVYYSVDGGDEQDWDGEVTSGPDTERIAIPLNGSTLPEGKYQFRLIVTDPYGRTGEDNFTVVVDRTAPIFDLLTEPWMTDPIYNDTFRVNVTTHDHDVADTSVSILDSMGDSHFVELIPPPDPEAETLYWIGIVDPVAMGIPDGDTIIRVDMIDDLGQDRHGEKLVVIDTTPPEIDVLSPADGETVTPGEVVRATMDIFENQEEEQTMDMVFVWVFTIDGTSITHLDNYTMERVGPSVYSADVLINETVMTEVWYLQFHVYDKAGNHAMETIALPIG